MIFQQVFTTVMQSFRGLILILLLGCGLWTQAPAGIQYVDSASLKPTDEHRKIALLVTRVIDQFHYRKLALDDTLSSAILDRYLKTLDPARMYFLASDIRHFENYRYLMDNALRNGRIEPAFDIFRSYRERVNTQIQVALERLKQDFDFTANETYPVDREGASWVKTPVELQDFWRKRVKNDYLALKIAGKADQDIRKTLGKRYQGILDRINQFTADDVFQTFINAYTLSIEPHTSYMSPSTSENFDISMRLSLEGIGAVLSQDNEYTKVQKTILGGPAQLSGALHAGDRIVAVGQGKDGDMEDVIGWRLQDVVDKIRGPKNSVVRLQLLPKSSGTEGPAREISLVRKEIALEEQAARAEIFSEAQDNANLRVGVIALPTFYRDFRGESGGTGDFRSTTRDVRKLLQDLTQQNVDGVVIDLRDNGGGSLVEATELTGLFIRQGPVVQVKDAFGKVEAEMDPDPEQVYRGPLAVLVDRNSASASEIFAGAIQDYGRGLIIGEPTFGKGTVQTLIALNRFTKDELPDLGRLRLTMAQFFRVNGESTQHRGVTPDVHFPFAANAAKQGERQLENALPWAKISQAKDVVDYHGRGKVDELQRASSARVQHDPGFALLTDRDKVLRELEDRKVVSLREDQRKAESEQRELRLKRQREDFLRTRGIAVTERDDEEPVPDDDPETKAIKGIELREATHILADYVRLTRQSGSLAQQHRE